MPAETEPGEVWTFRDRDGVPVLRLTRPVESSGIVGAARVDDAIVIVPSRSAMHPDEFLDCLGRRGTYTACRKVHTIGRRAARRAGL